MSDDELNRILGADAKIVPSSGFTRAVMDRVLLEATAPPPIAFPWVRAIPGLAAGIFFLSWMVFNGVPQSDGTASGSWNFADLLAMLSKVPSSQLWRGAEAAGVGWIILALLLTLVTVRWSARLTG